MVVVVVVVVIVLLVVVVVVAVAVAIAVAAAVAAGLEIDNSVIVSNPSSPILECNIQVSFTTYSSIIAMGKAAGAFICAVGVLMSPVAIQVLTISPAMWGFSFLISSILMSTL